MTAGGVEAFSLYQVAMHSITVRYSQVPVTSFGHEHENMEVDFRQ